MAPPQTHREESRAATGGSGRQPGKEAASAGETRRQTRTHGHGGKGIARHARYPRSPTHTHLRTFALSQALSLCHVLLLLPALQVCSSRLGAGHITAPDPTAPHCGAPPRRPGRRKRSSGPIAPTIPTPPGKQRGFSIPRYKRQLADTSRQVADAQTVRHNRGHKIAGRWCWQGPIEPGAHTRAHAHAHTRLSMPPHQVRQRCPGPVRAPWT